MMTMLNSRLVVDIETRPLPNDGEGFDPESVKFGVLKDKEKRKNKVEEERVKFKQGSALDPFQGAICAIGYLHPSEPARIVTASNETEEKALLKEFWELFVHSRLIGHNFREFDMPFIVTRSRILDVLGRLNYGKKYGSIIDSKIEDTMEEVACYKFGARISLKAAASAFGVRSKLRASESSSIDFWKCLSSGDAVKEAKAKNHLLADLEETLAVAQRCGML
jgi:DNA polymerase elongation subunit (family B)